VLRNSPPQVRDARSEWQAGRIQPGRSMTPNLDGTGVATLVFGQTQPFGDRTLPFGVAVGTH